MYTRVYSPFLYVFEKVNYVVMFVAWVVFKVDPKMIGISFAGLAVVAVMTIVVIINEMLLEKVSTLDFDLESLMFMFRQNCV